MSAWQIGKNKTGTEREGVQNQVKHLLLIMDTPVTEAAGVFLASITQKLQLP